MIHYLELLGQTAALLTFIWGFIKGSREKLNQIITSNNNRIRDDVIKEVTVGFQAHEDGAFKRIDKLETSVKEITSILEEIRKGGKL